MTTTLTAKIDKTFVKMEESEQELLPTFKNKVISHNIPQAEQGNHL